MKNLNLPFKSRLKSLGLTQVDFAKMIGSSPSTVRNALSNQTMPRWRELEWGKILDEYEARQQQAGEDS